MVFHKLSSLGWANSLIIHSWFFLNDEWILKFVKCYFYNYLDYHMVFSLLLFFSMVNYINWFWIVKPTWSWAIILIYQSIWFAQSLSHVQLVGESSPPDSSVHGNYRQEYWSVLPFLLQGILMTQGSNPCLLCLLHWQVVSSHWNTWEVFFFNLIGG